MSQQITLVSLIFHTCMASQYHPIKQYIFHMQQSLHVARVIGCTAYMGPYIALTKLI